MKNDELKKIKSNHCNSVNKFNDSWKDQWSIYRQKSLIIQHLFDYSSKDLLQNQALTEKNRGDLKIRSIKWFLPSFENVYGGGIYTIFRFANYLLEKYSVSSIFIVFNNPAPDIKLQKKFISIAFPTLKSSTVLALDDINKAKSLPYTDASICTFWSTAYAVLKDNQTKKKFYFIQDYEPFFYPAGSTSGLVEATYNFNFYGIANTVTLGDMYKSRYGGIAEHFNPCVNTDLFYPEQQLVKDSSPLRIFFYGRPHVPRNGFELGISALKNIKLQMGGKINITTAGGGWIPSDYGLDGIVENLGILTVQQTAEIYRNCYLGLTFMFTPHPSYIPLELMASKCAVLANDNPANRWLLRDNETCFISPPTVSCLTEKMMDVLKNKKKRDKIVNQAYRLVTQNYSDWNNEIEKIYKFMCSSH